MTPQLQAVLGQAISDLGGTANAALVLVGDRLGLYRNLADMGSATPAELAERTGTHERLVREWLCAQAASQYVTYDSASGRFSMSPEQVLVFADGESPYYMAGGFFSAAAAVNDEMKLAEAFASGEGIGWGDHHSCLFCGTEKFFRPGYAAHLVQSWLPALTGVVAKLNAGATVADIGCGHGSSTLVMARAFPQSRFTGFDNHEASIARARELAERQGLGNVEFHVGSAQRFPVREERPYDLVAVFDALHDMGDPRGAARQVRGNLADDGCWMIVEPAAADSLEDNLNPISRVFYAMSTAICVPSAMSQNGGEALGAQAGPAAIAEVARASGFSRFRTAISTPFNLVFEARP